MDTVEEAVALGFLCHVDHVNEGLLRDTTRRQYLKYVISREFGISPLNICRFDGEFN